MLTPMIFSKSGQNTINGLSISISRCLPAPLASKFNTSLDDLIKQNLFQIKA
jgi:hypothetical protein